MVKECWILVSTLTIVLAAAAVACASGPDGIGPGAPDPGADVEACNGLDDDGDGLVDEGASGAGLMAEPCSTICGPGERLCIGGAWSACSAPAPGASGECPCADGDVRPCSSPCGPGVETCLAGAFAGCTAQLPVPEECANGRDDDCDGAVDEECGECSPGETRRCGSDAGDCRSGTRTCRPDGTWSSCAGDVGPRSETCDGRDNDCDGETDEGLPADLHEANDTCSMARRLADVVEGAGETSLTATVYPSADVDWFWIRAVEGFHDCEPFTGQCYYDLTVTLDAAAGADLSVCLYPGWPSDSPPCDAVSDPGNEYCIEAGESGLALEWEGVCMLDDSVDFAARIQTRPGGEPTCEPYTLRFALEGPTDACPGGY